MKPILLILLFASTARATPAEVEAVCFSPHGGCTALVVREIDQAKREIRVEAYSFTSEPIANALIAAAKRGVDVRVIVDKSNRSGRYSEAPALLQAHVPLMVDSAHAIAHNKVIVVDGDVMCTGSFNLTNAAELHNAENLIVIRSVAVAELYLANWTVHWAHAKAWRVK